MAGGHRPENAASHGQAPQLRMPDGECSQHRAAALSRGHHPIVWFGDRALAWWLGALQEKAVFQLDIRQLRLVFEALAERRSLLDNAPHLTRALPILTVSVPPARRQQEKQMQDAYTFLPRVKQHRPLGRRCLKAVLPLLS